MDEAKYGPALLQLLKRIRDYQDREMTFATRENALFRKHTEAWMAMNNAMMLVLPLVGHFNPEAAAALAGQMETIIELSGEVEETTRLRAANIDALGKDLRAIRLEMGDIET